MEIETKVNLVKIKHYWRRKIKANENTIYVIV